MTRSSNSTEARDRLEADALPVYRVCSSIWHGTTADDQCWYEPGERIALADADAIPLLACGAIESIEVEHPA